MRISRINIPAETARFTDGLGAIKMDKIQRTVVIAGRNGSGKSRLLARIVEVRNIVEQGRHAEKTEANLDRTRGKSRLRNQEDEKHLEAIKSMSWWKFQSDSESDRPEVVNFIVQGRTVNDPFQIGDSRRQQECRVLLEKLGSGNLPSGTLSLIQTVQDEYWEATHPNSNLTKQQRDEASANYDRLQGLIMRFLGTTLGRADGQAVLFGLRIGVCRLSTGQDILLQFCAAIYSQSTRLDGAIIVMDEPENHLHPCVMLDFIKTVEGALPNGQLWIATHSLPLLAHVDPSSIWWMDNGVIQYAGNIPRKVLEGLLGTEDSILKLSVFLNLPFELAATEYAFKCLCEPEVVGLESDDPQIRQILTVLDGKVSGLIKVLDYGAGKGRLVAAIQERYGSDSKERIDYTAYDESSKDAEHCQDAIARVYGKTENSYFNHQKDLLAHASEGSYDFVVMCNVFHEIPVDEWSILFSEQALIHRLLNAEGFLLLVEDMHIPIGEKPHQKGFLVLDTPEIKTLFKIEPSDSSFGFSAERDDRLKAHRIPKGCLSRITSESRQKALRQVAHNAKREIGKLRVATASYPNGRLHGFWVQQLANAELALDAMK
jgi:predicted ATPase